ncbi:MAG: DUF2313 domain-containing protein [Clostridiales bacterium]|nr:DUF2313 domain-containing protein [Clostridiales bacterium]
MGYSEYLKTMLQPLGIYDLTEGVGAEEIAVIGKQLDDVFNALEELGRESVLVQAESYGLQMYEEILPYRPAYITVEDQRRAILALLRIRGGCFTLDMLQDTIGGCGIEASIEEGEEPMTAVVRFVNNRGIPDGFDRLKRRIEEIVPCHIYVQYMFIYSTWQDLMNKLPNWAAIEERTNSWREFEIYE